MGLLRQKVLSDPVIKQLRYIQTQLIIDETFVIYNSDLIKNFRFLSEEELTIQNEQLIIKITNEINKRYQAIRDSF